MRKAEVIRNPRLSGKIIYIVATGAKKVSKIEAMVDAFLLLDATVYVFMTYPAEQMVGQDALARLLTKCEVRRDFSWNHPNPPLPDEDLVLVAPCTFNSLIKLSLGIADDYALTIVSNAIARHKRVLIAPAFNESWYHPSTVDAISRLSSWGVNIIYPEITHEKVTMMDINKIIDYAAGQLQKIKFNSTRYYDDEHITLLETSRAKYADDFRAIGDRQHRIGHNSGIHGCYSVRVNDDWALVTASGSDLSKLDNKDLTLLRLDSNSAVVEWCGDRAPTSEAHLHIDLYLQSAARAIIHSHNPKLTYADSLRVYATPAYVPYGVVEHTCDVTKQVIRQDGFAILKYHGEIAIGSDLQEAAGKLSMMEEKV